MTFFLGQLFMTHYALLLYFSIFLRTMNPIYIFWSLKYKLIFNQNDIKMKKTILILSVLFMAILCNANTYQDTIVNSQITKEVVEKLSNEELIQLIKEVEYIKSTKSLIPDEEFFMIQHLNNTGFVKAIIITLVISLMILIVLLISIPFYFNYRKTRSFHRMINTFIENNMEIPGSIITNSYHTKSDLQKSIILISTGLGISLVFILLEIGGRIWSIGLIPVVIGIGYFVSSRLEK